MKPRVPIDPAAAAALWRAGHSTPEIAWRLGCSAAGAYNSLKRQGLAGPGNFDPTSRKRGSATPAHRKALRAQGYSCLVERRRERWGYLSELHWPGCGYLTRSQQQTLRVLEEAGQPQTGTQLQQALGLTPRDNRHGGPGWFSGRLHALKVRGLLARRRDADRWVRWSLAGPAAEAVRRRAERRDLA